MEDVLAEKGEEEEEQMSPEEDDEVRRELAEVEELIASVRRDGEGAAEETPDAADAASELVSTAEDEAVLQTLEARRDRLRDRLRDG